LHFLDHLATFFLVYNQLTQLAKEEKATGKQILSNTDWTAIASVGDPAESNPYLTTRQAFLEYRSTVRAIVLNPAFDSVFPVEPTEVWSS
jgi:hypothetical protein